MKHTRGTRPSMTVLAAALSVMALAACNRNGAHNSAQNATTTADTAAPALPLTTGAETTPIYAPSASALPPAPRPKIVRVASQADEYAYVDQAASMGQAFGNAPPDYGFDYGGEHPWVWRANDNAERVIEPIDGGYRYYYYQPGAASPYLIRDPQYAYGFNDGQLVVVYDARGNVLPPQYMEQQADYAGRYLARARALHQASLRSEHRSVVAANWAARRAEINAEQAQWAREQSQYSAWQAYHQEHESEQQAYWQAERQRREAAASHFDQWQNAGYQGPPPPPASSNGAVAAGVIGGAVGALIAGQRDHHDDHRDQPQPQSGQAPSFAGRRPGDQGGPPNPGFDRGQGADQRQAQAAQSAQAQQQAAAAQGRQQQAQAEAARQAQVQAQTRAVADARQQQTQQDALRQGRLEAQAHQHDQSAAVQRAEAASAQQAAAHAQAEGQAAAVRQAQEAQRAQAAQAHQQQAAQAAAQAQAARQTQTAAQAQARIQAQAQAQAATRAAAAAKAAPALAPAAIGGHPHPGPGGPPGQDPHPGEHHHEGDKPA